MNIYTSSHRKAMRTVAVKRYNPNVPLVPFRFLFLFVQAKP